jgi:hypothetical protein
MIGNFRLVINDKAIDTHPFIESFVEHTLNGMLEALKDTRKIKDLDLTVKGEDIKINLNGELVHTNSMTGKLIKSTLVGMVSTLQGVQDIKNLSISVHK